MKTLSITHDTLMKRYLTAASVLLLLFTVTAPSLGITFAACNAVFFAVRVLLKKEKPGRRFKWRMLLGILLSNVFLLAYISCARETLSADQTATYSETLKCGMLMQMDMPGYFNAVFSGLQRQTHSLLPTVFIAPLLTVFGGSYPAFVLLNFNLFLVPFFLVMALLLREINPKSVPLIFLFSPFLTPVLQGSLDGAGLLYIALWMFVLYKQTFRKKATKEAVLLGLLSVVLVLTRLWYLYFILGTFLALLLSVGVRLLYDKSYSAKTVFKNLWTVFVVFTVPVVLLLFPYLKHFVSTIFQWDGALLWQNVKASFGYYGALPLFCFFLGVMGLRRRHFRQFTIFLLFYVSSVFVLLAGKTVLTPGLQYLLAPAFFLLAIIGVSAFRKQKIICLIALYAVFCIAFVYSYIPTGDFLHGVFPTERIAPQKGTAEWGSGEAEKLSISRYH